MALVFLFREKEKRKEKCSPAHELNELGRQRDPGLGVHDRRPRVADEVGGDDGVTGDAEDAYDGWFDLFIYLFSKKNKSKVEGRVSFLFFFLFVFADFFSFCALGPETKEER